MIRIAICDDEEKALEQGAAACDDLIPQLTTEAYQLKTFTNPVDMLAFIEEENCGFFDLILCDIYMPGILGIDAIKELRDANDSSHVIFLTSSPDHAVDAFAVHADGYVLKPFGAEQFRSVVEPVIKQIVKEHLEYLPVKARTGLHRIDFATIVYAETSGHDQAIHLTDGSVVETRLSSQALFDRLAEDSRFFKAGSSYILNLDMIRSVEGCDATMTDSTVVKVPSRVRKQLADAFFDRSFEVAF